MSYIKIIRPLFSRNAKNLPFDFFAIDAGPGGQTRTVLPDAGAAKDPRSLP
jgi:hypothetical protein